MKIYTSPFKPFDPKLAERNYGQFMREKWLQYPDNVFIDAGSGLRYTGSECAVLSKKISVQLMRRGIGTGDILAICSPSSIRVPIFLSAVWAINAAASGLDFGFREDEYTDLARVYQPKVFVCVKANLQVALQVKTVLPCIQFVVILDDDSESSSTRDDCIVPFGALSAQSGNAEDLKVSEDPDLLAYMPRTSGTTGRSKAVMHTHRTMLSAVLMQGTEEMMPLPQGSMVMTTSSFHHVFALFDVFGACLNRGFSVVHPQSHDPKLIMEHIQNFKVSVMFTTPFVVLSILNLFKIGDAAATSIDLSSLRVLITGSNIFPESSFAHLRQCLPHLTCFGNLYGQTEIISAFSHRLSGFEKPCTIGNVLANGEFRIVCPETLEDVTQPGQRGELWVRLLSRFVGYYKDEKAFKEALTDDGWYRTGDVGTVDEHGFVTLMSRLKEFIKTKYTTISPTEVEAKILQHPKVRDVAVIGLPHPILQSALHAIIAPNEPLTEEEIHRFMEETTPDIYKLEGGISICEAVPRTPIGKVMRPKLVEWVLERQKRR